MPETKRPLKVFLSYASQDKPVVRELSRRLIGEGWIDTWLDVKKLLPGQDWRLKIEEAVEDSDIVIICLSSNSISKEGYVQKELRYAREIALEKPEDTIFLIPLRLDECEVPRGLRFYQWADYFEEKKDESYKALIESLKLQYEKKLALEEAERARKKQQEQQIAEKNAREKKEREIAEKLAQEKAAREKAVREKAKKDAKAKAKLEKTERRTTQIAALKGIFSKPLPNIKPFLRIVGFIGIILMLFWFGSWVIPKFPALVSTVNARNASISSVTVTFTNHLGVVSTSTPNFVAIPTETLALTPTSLPIEITDTRGMLMRLVPAGDFTMGSNIDDVVTECKKYSIYCPSDFYKDETPAHTVSLNAFYIDKYEVTNASYANCVNDSVCKPPISLGSYSRTNYYGNKAYDDYPVIYVNWEMAQTYCSWRNARLPTEAEWEKAARGVDGRQYPWGEGIDCTLANVFSCVGDTNQVGSYKDGQSIYGVFDMVGNVWEWVSDWYQSDYYSTLDSVTQNPLGPTEGSARVVRGGSWNYNKFNARSAFRGWHSPMEAFNRTGFRCAKDAP